MRFEIVNKNMPHGNSISQKGSRNSQYGKSWYYNPVTQESRSFRKTDTIPTGWIKGRICNNVNAKNQSKLLSQRLRQKYDLNPKYCEYCGKVLPYEKRFCKTCNMEEGRLLNALHNHETQQVRHSSGGKRHGSGRGKKGWYKGYWCDSSWELAAVIYWIDHGIKFERYTGFFSYKYDGKLKKYYPDFLMADGSFIEIKGYSSKQWKAKITQFPADKKIKVLYKKDINLYLKYVTNTYGKDFIKLYEHGPID